MLCRLRDPKLIDEVLVYCVSSAALLSLWPLAWKMEKLTILRMVIALFVWDSVLTIEAAYYGNILLIAILHVITIPALLSLLYFDLIKQGKSSYTCFVCSKPILAVEQMETLSRIVEGAETKFAAHTFCLDLGRKERKVISRRNFRRGIPE